MATTPAYAATPKVGRAAISTANANRDGTGTIASGFAPAGGENWRAEKSIIHALVTTTAGMIRIFHHDGSNFSLIKEIKVPAKTASATEPAWSYEYFYPDGHQVPDGHSLRFSTEKAESFIVTTVGGKY